MRIHNRSCEMSSDSKAGCVLLKAIVRPFIMAFLMTLQLVPFGCYRIDGELYTSLFETPTGNYYNCSIVLERGGERRIIDNHHALFGDDERKFFTCPEGDECLAYDLNGDGVRNEADAIQDWRHWVHYHLQLARESEDATVREQWRGWCEVPESAELTSRAGSWSDSPPVHDALPDVTMSVCPESPETCVHAAFSSSEPAFGEPLSHTTELEWSVDSVCVGAESRQDICLTNCGTEDLVITGAGIPVSAQSADFEIVWNECVSETMGGILRDGVLEAGESCFLQVEFDPPSPGERQAAVVFNTRDSDLETIEINLTAQAEGGAISVPATATFHEIPTGGGCTHETTICITNTGCGQLEISNFHIEDSDFQVIDDPTETDDPERSEPFLLSPSGSGSTPEDCGGLPLTIRYCPSGSATVDGAILEITSDDAYHSTVEVELTIPGE